MDEILLEILNKCISKNEIDSELFDLLNEAVSITSKYLFANLNSKEPIDLNKIDYSFLSPNKKEMFELLKSEKWPEAVPSFLICHETDDDKFERAEGIIDYLELNLVGKKLLDFGCGEGHIALKASETANYVVGYDILTPIKESLEKCLLTSNISDIEKHGPYDIIILYDVLDHIKDFDSNEVGPVTVLKQLKKVCHNETRIYVRCHSWMSRHGAHLYKRLNKAYIHLYFSEEDLNRFGLTLDFSRKYYFPIDEQKKWFRESGWKVQSEDIVKSFVESLFKQPVMKFADDKIVAKFDKNFPDWQMSQSFNDYILKLG